MANTDSNRSASQSPPPNNANDYIERQLDHGIAELEDVFDADLITFHGPLYVGVDDLLRMAVEKKHVATPTRMKAVIILTTPGGYIEVVHRMVDTLRRHYEVVDFIVPNYAYSAGTILVMSGDAIHMDYYSRLGPIDPQVETPDGNRSVPALGYLERYEGLVKKATEGRISVAEVQLMINGFDQAELYQYEHQRELSITLLKEWLCKYKFKDWKATRTRKARVTRAMKESRARTIARQLNDTRRWHSHGYGISMEVLERDLKLQIDDFGAHPTISTKIRVYHDLLSDYMARRRTQGVIHFKGEYKPFM